jgi:hypothetical protein
MTDTSDGDSATRPPGSRQRGDAGDTDSPEIQAAVRRALADAPPMTDAQAERIAARLRAVPDAEVER